MTQNTQTYDQAIDKTIRETLANKYSIKNPSRRQLRKVKQKLPKKGLVIGSYKQR